VKVVYVVLDGAAGSPIEAQTAYTIARKPGLDRIAREGVSGCFYPIGPGRAPESDVAVLSILGYGEELYPGRGPIEALGAGYELMPGEVAFRGNLATVDPETLRIIDRRAGRDLSDEEAKSLLAPLAELSLRGGEAYARVIHTVGYRAVVVLGSRKERLSPNVSNTDPAYGREGGFSVALASYEPVVKPCEPLDGSQEAAYTCELVTEFSQRAMELLESHEVNKKREAAGKLKANYILLRDAGGVQPGFPKFTELHGVRGAAVVDMPVEVGIARAVGLDAYRLRPSNPPSREDLEERLSLTLRLLESYDFVYIHIKGPDEPGHDGDCLKKARVIEAIDAFYVKPLVELAAERGFAVVVLSDHATPCYLRAHSADPVPIGVYYRGAAGDGFERFAEGECCKGSIGVLEHGTLVMRVVKGLWGA